MLVLRSILLLVERSLLRRWARERQHGIRVRVSAPPMSQYGDVEATDAHEQDEEFDPSGGAVYRSLAHHTEGDAEKPLYRSMSGAPDFPDIAYTGDGCPFSDGAQTTFEPEQPVYRSLSYMPQPSLQSVSAQSAALAKPTLEVVPARGA